jgi:hypothetical protein
MPNPRRCRERLFDELRRLDDDPKIYPILPAEAGYDVLCVWSHDGSEFVGSYDEFLSEASGYHAKSPCLYFTVPREVADRVRQG